MLLKKALNDERTERIRIQAAEMEKVLKNLTPIHVPQPKDNRISELEKDLIQVKHVSKSVKSVSILWLFSMRQVFLGIYLKKRMYLTIGCF